MSILLGIFRSQNPTEFFFFLIQCGVLEVNAKEKTTFSLVRENKVNAIKLNYRSTQI